MSQATAIRPTRILVPIDGSPAAFAALDWAIAAAGPDPAIGSGDTVRPALHILHVVDVDPNAGMSMQLQRGADALLDAGVKRASAAGVTASPELAQGRPWEVITAAAMPGDLIVLGARGQTPFDRHAVGATVDRVVRTAPCPVLTLPNTGCPAPGAVQRAVVGMDFSSDALAALDQVLGLLAPDGTVVLVHGTPPPIVVSDGPVSPLPDVDIDGMLADSRAGLERLIAERIPAGVRGIAVAAPLYPVHAIEDAAKDHDADIVAVGTHGRRGLPRWLMGSVAERVLHHVSCATLIVRSAGDAK